MTQKGIRGEKAIQGDVREKSCCAGLASGYDELTNLLLFPFVDDTPMILMQLDSVRRLFSVTTPASWEHLSVGRFNIICWKTGWV